jgi:hypothetical protein
LLAKIPSIKDFAEVENDLQKAITEFNKGYGK